MVWNFDAYIMGKCSVSHGEPRINIGIAHAACLARGTKTEGGPAKDTLSEGIAFCAPAQSFCCEHRSCSDTFDE